MIFTANLIKEAESALCLAIDFRWAVRPFQTAASKMGIRVDVSTRYFAGSSRFEFKQCIEVIHNLLCPVYFSVYIEAIDKLQHVFRTAENMFIKLNF